MNAQKGSSTSDVDYQWKYFHAIPLYSPNDREIFEFFRDDGYIRELKEITKDAIVIVMAEQVRDGNDQGVYEVVRSSGRYRLRRADLPCLWIEDEDDGYAAIKLPNDKQEIREVMKQLADAAATAGAEDTAKTIAKCVTQSSQQTQLITVKQIGLFNFNWIKQLQKLKFWNKARN